MIIKSHLSEKEFVQASFAIFYKNTAAKVLIVIVTFVFIISLLAFVLAPDNIHIHLSFSNFIPLLIIVFLHLSVYNAAKKAYKTNHQLREATVYHIDMNKMLVEGETYSATFKWNTIVKVTQTKNWILIWQTKQRANPIPIKDVWSGQLADFKDVLEANHVKNNLNYLP